MRGKLGAMRESDPWAAGSNEDATSGGVKNGTQAAQSHRAAEREVKASSVVGCKISATRGIAATATLRKAFSSAVDVISVDAPLAGLGLFVFSQEAWPIDTGQR
jgi:hypothetical protein